MKQIYILALILFFNSINLNAQTALDFDPSVNQQVKIPGITCPPEFTFEAWINYRGQTGTYPTIFEFGNDAPFIGLKNNHLTLYTAVEAPLTFPMNKWVHIAVSYSTTNSEAKLYIDGILVASETVASLSLRGVGAGIGYNGTDLVFNGAIDDVRVWNVIRTEAEIMSNKGVCLTGTETNLHAFYNLNEGSGAMVNDLSTNNFNGTLINMDISADWISYNSCSALSVEDKNNDHLDLTLLPNPSSDRIKISGLRKSENYSIYNVLGTKINNGIISNNETINIQNLTSGLYLLKLENRNIIKFIKE